MRDGNPASGTPKSLEYHLNWARVVSEKSTCLRRKVGVVIVRHTTQLSVGYMGSPKGTPSCIDIGKCLLTELEIPLSREHAWCRSIHAEQNAIISAARSGVDLAGGEMYVSSERIEEAYGQGEEEASKIDAPCMMCKKMIINAGLRAVHIREEGIGVLSYIVAELREILAQEEDELRRTYGHDGSGKDA